jgi:hypothetical protein
MPKSVDDIIVPERRRSIRDIPIPENRRRTTSFTAPVKSEDHIKTAREVFGARVDRGLGSIPPTRSSRGGKGKWFAIIVALLVVAFAGMSFFNSSTFTYVPKTDSFSLEESSLTAKKSGEGALLFSVVKISKEKGVDLPASGEEDVSRKASGVIVVYNNASAEAQKLIATTRFQTPTGLVYRAPNDFTIPGRKTVNGVIQPGSVEITVYADEGGEEYNIAPSDFTLPGLAGTPRFTTVYARSKTSMTGGFAGKEKVVDPSELERAQAQLKTVLTQELVANASSQAPNDFILIPELSSTQFEVLPQTVSQTQGSAVINLRGNFSGVMFKRSDLAKALLGDKINLASGESVDILDWESLVFSYGETVPHDLPTAEELVFNVSGSGKIVWQTDEVALKSDLRGRHKNEVSAILNNYPSIISATPVFKPFWKSSFPEDISRIMVKKILNE